MYIHPQFNRSSHIRQAATSTTAVRVLSTSADASLSVSSINSVCPRYRYYCLYLLSAYQVPGMLQGCFFHPIYDLPCVVLVADENVIVSLYMVASHVSLWYVIDTKPSTAFYLVKSNGSYTAICTWVVYIFIYFWTPARFWKKSGRRYTEVSGEHTHFSQKGKLACSRFPVSYWCPAVVRIHVQYQYQSSMCRSVWFCTIPGV